MTYQKNVHYSQDLEMAVLGACMLETTAFGRTYGLVDDKTFYYTGHGKIYQTLKDMYESGLPIDVLTVCDLLTRVQGVEQIQNMDTAYFVTRLTNSVVSTSHLEYHCHILKSMWVERQLINLTHGGLPEAANAKEQITALQKTLHDLASGSVMSEWKDMSELMVELYEHQSQMEKTQGMGITTGLRQLDRHNGGFHPGQVVVLAARPSVGKSALMGQMALSMARDGKKVGIISLEMNNAEIAGRIAAIDSDVNFDSVYRGLFKDDQQRQYVYNRINNHTSQLPIMVSDKTNVNIHEIRSKAMKLKHQFGLDVLAIDYLQLVEGEDNNRNRENEISRISRGAKVLAKELGIVVIALCQMNREVTKRKGNDRYPQLSDLRESGALEQDADVAMFLHRDFMSGFPEKEDGSSTEYEADLVVRKWRNGVANWILPLEFDPPKMQFKEKSRFIPVTIRSPLGEKDDNPF